ncbi:MAG: YfhO family protein [Deltaproteobacteria bacterium]|nr:YfhO family protein [Deltaproteobacteria bacterium]MBW2018481.1 YfhO family protein [Deltaproteobacteria bacterium]MBW2074138.1 YfhO family protein [Deltaproteobacteria bacterium]
MSISLKKRDFLFCGLLFVVALCFFKDIIIKGYVLWGSDFVCIYLPMKQFLYNQIQYQHSIPFWNPHIFSGMPFWAHFESTIFYPIDMLFWILPPEKAYGYTMFVHVILSGIFMYMLCRSFGISRSGAFIAAIVFSYNGYIMAVLYGGQMCPVQSYVWMPLILFFLNRSTHSQTPFIHATIAGAIWGVQILAGAPQDAFYTFMAVSLFLVCHVNTSISGRHSIRTIMISGLLVFVFGCGISSLQLIPALEFVQNSFRATLHSYDWATKASYPIQVFITTLMPHFFGNFTQNNYWVADTPWSIPLQNLYLGILPFICLCFLRYEKGDSRRQLLFCTLLAVISLVLALGKHTPIYRFVYLIPGFSGFRAPSKIIILWMLSLSILAGQGFDSLLSCDKKSWRIRLTFIILLALLLIALDVLFLVDKKATLKVFSPFILKEAIPDRLGQAAAIIQDQFSRLTIFFCVSVLVISLWLKRGVRRELASACLILVMLIDFWHANIGVIQPGDTAIKQLKVIRQQLDMSIGQDNTIFRVGSIFPMYGPRYGPNIEMYCGYQTVGGYCALFLNRYYKYINQQYDDGSIPEGWQIFYYRPLENGRLIDLLNVKYEISYATREYALRKNYLPRVFIVPDYKILNSEEVLDYLIRSDFDPTQIVLLEKGVQLSDPSRHLDQKPGATGRATITSYRPDEIVILTDSPGARYLFLSEVFYPGWKAFVDDQPKPILRGNYLFRVIQLPEGQHVVHFVFDSLSIKIGIGITILTLFLFIVVMIYHFRERIPCQGR